MAVLVDNAMEVEVTVNIVVVDMDLVTVVVLDMLDRAMDLRVDIARSSRWWLAWQRLERRWSIQSLLTKVEPIIVAR